MTTTIAIVGSGPTGIFALQTLIKSPTKLAITIFEGSELAGKGTPYQRGINDPSMLSNIPSVEIPELPQTLHGWLLEQPDAYLIEHEIKRSAINDRTFYARVVVGDYFRAQFLSLMSSDSALKHDIKVVESCRVEDIVPVGSRFQLTTICSKGRLETMFDFAVVATGHSFPANPESAPGYFDCPWPANALKTVPAGEIGVLGTSLSAIDAVMTLATSFGRFAHDKDGTVKYRQNEDQSAFRITMMSRKGLLPEADFYFPIPYLEPTICTWKAVEDRVRLGSSGLLDNIFELFRQEITFADPKYASDIKLHELTVDDFAQAYYGVRDKIDPFEWAESNLAEAETNYQTRHTIAWRYAILITHEIIEGVVCSLNADDLSRFNRSFKSIFADDYATVPHLSIKRLLALYRAGHIEILALGDETEITTEGLNRGAMVRVSNQLRTFETFIDATGQKSQSASDLPFPGLLERGVVSEARTITASGNHRRTGGIDVDEQCRPLMAGTRPIRRLYIPAVSYLLHKRPFIQGITSAAELGVIVGASIIADVTRPRRSRRRGSRQVQRAMLGEAA